MKFNQVLLILSFICLCFLGQAENVNSSINEKQNSEFMDVDITIRVNMSNETVDPSGVFIAGGGNFGNPGDNPLTDMGGGIWEITVTQPQNFSSFYTITNGICPDYSCKENLAGLPCGDPANFNDRFMGPVSADTTLLHCFGECTTDLSCSVPVADVNVTFQVDMTDTPPVGPIYVTGGNLDGWCGSCLEMTDPDMDNIYTYTMALQPGTYEYKYNNGGWGGTEALDPVEDAACTLTTGNYTNRIVTVTADEVINVVCFNSCVACSVPPPTPVDVTFQLDMSQETVLGPIYLTGDVTLDNWCGTCLEMTDPDMDGIYTYTASILPGSTFEYKYNNGGWGGTEALDPTEDAACTLTTGNFTNRIHTTGDANETLDVVCFNSCDDCPAPCDAPTDLSFQIVSGASVDLNWSDVAGAVKYKLRWREFGTSPWNFSVITSSNTTLSGLTEGVRYEYTVQTNCGPGILSSPASIKRWEQDPCQSPLYSSISSTTTDVSADLTWTSPSVSSVWGYKVKYMPMGTSSWSMATDAYTNSPSQMITLNELMPGTTYMVRVQSLCSGGGRSFFYGGNATFTTQQVRKGLLEEEVAIYPNPATNILNITYNVIDIEVDVEINVVDITGQIVQSLQKGANTGYQNESLDISRLKQGYYFVSIKAGGEMVTKKFAVIK